jgi:hypothetical protein
MEKKCIKSNKKLDNIIKNLKNLLDKKDKKYDINLFYEKSCKAKNSESNKKREIIIEKLLNNEIPKEYLNNKEWKDLYDALQKYIFKKNLESFKCIRKGGRCNKYDFEFIVKYRSGVTITKKVEFKYNTKFVKNLPQFLSLYSNFNLYNDNLVPQYSEFFYDNFIEKLSENAEIKVSDKKLYLKYIHQTNYDKYDWFRLMKNKENNKEYVKEKKELVDESIDLYLLLLELHYKEHGHLMIDKINKKLLDQVEKEYMCFKNGVFYYDKLLKEELHIIDLKELKSNKDGYNNTLIFSTKSKTSEIHFLLRWRNCAGILMPAWQISIKR